MAGECKPCIEAVKTGEGRGLCAKHEAQQQREDEQYCRDRDDTDRRYREADIRLSCGIPQGCDTVWPR
jgi:hypothetical protein